MEVAVRRPSPGTAGARSEYWRLVEVVIGAVGLAAPVTRRFIEPQSVAYDRPANAQPEVPTLS